MVETMVYSRLRPGRSHLYYAPLPLAVRLAYTHWTKGILAHFPVDAPEARICDGRWVCGEWVADMTAEEKAMYAEEDDEWSSTVRGGATGQRAKENSR